MGTVRKILAWFKGPKSDLFLFAVALVLPSLARAFGLAGLPSAATLALFLAALLRRRGLVRQGIPRATSALTGAQLGLRDARLAALLRLLRLGLVGFGELLAR